MERGVVVTKYGKKGAASQRVLFLDGTSMSVAWRDLDARSPGHRRTPSFTNLLKGQREALALSHLVEVSDAFVWGCRTIRRWWQRKPGGACCPARGKKHF